MLRRLLVALVILVLVPLAVPAAGGGSPLSPSRTARPGAPGTWIVVLKDPADMGARLAVTRRASTLGAAVTGFYRRLGVLAVNLPSPLVDTLRRDPNVAYVAPDRPVHLIDEGSPAGASAAAAPDGASVPPGVARIGAARTVQDAPDGPAAAAAVAILDTGVSRRAELNVVGGYNCARDVFSDLLGGDGTDDRNGHGTHVAGIVGARPGRAGVVGVSPGTPIYAVRVFPRFGSAQLSQVVCGLNWVADNAADLGIKVVNMSLGGAGSDDHTCGMKEENAFHTAVCRVVDAGVTVVVAAGNDSGDLSKTMPASFSEVLTVTAMAAYTGAPGGAGSPPAGCRTSNRDGQAADFSSYAVPDSPTAGHVIAAPGVCITSTWIDGGTKTISGTSMAAPHVSGLVARCIDAGVCAGKTPAEIIARLQADAAARPAEAGFVGDVRHPIPGKYYGNLAVVAGY